MRKPTKFKQIPASSLKREISCRVIMAKSPETSLQSSRLRKLVGLAITDAKFRKALESNPKEAINSKRQELEFGYDELAKVSVDVLIEKAHDSDGTV